MVRRDGYEKMSDSKFEYFKISNQWLSRGEKRLDAKYYQEKNITAQIIIDRLKENSFQIDSLNNLIENIYWLGRIKKNFVSKNEGDPYLTASECFFFLPQPRKYVFNFPEDKIETNKTILITRSASLGRSIIVNDYLAKFKISDDLIRVILNDTSLIGYIYAYLNTSIGKAFLTMGKYGKTVKHIEDYNIIDIPIPRIPFIEEKINQKMIKSYQIRNLAQKKVLEAKELLLTKLNLSKINEEKINYFGEEEGRLIKCFSSKTETLDLRLDASYHAPIITWLISNLYKSKTGQIKKLKEVSEIFLPPRFKRIYTNDINEGVPLLQGSHIIQNKPLDLKYLWKDMKNINAYIIKKNWILITCSGTIGRLSLISDYWKDWTATNHLLRIIPENRIIHPGYLAAFLLSDYGQFQLKRLSYGGVVDEIGEAGRLFNEILILKPKDIDIERTIGNIVVEAFNNRDKAAHIEQECIQLLEKELEKFIK